MNAHATSRTPEPEREESSHTVRIAVAWTIVGVPLAYGISQTLLRAAQLFTG